MSAKKIDRSGTYSTSTPSTTPPSPVKPIGQVTLIIAGVMYELAPVYAAHPLRGHEENDWSEHKGRAVQGVHAMLARAEKPEDRRHLPTPHAGAYVLASVEAVHGWGCWATHQRKGVNGPCDCGAHQALAELLSRGRA